MLTSEKLCKILVIEDNIDDAVLMEKLISKCGHDQYTFQPEQANTLRHGLDLLATTKYQLILLDLVLPDAQGFEVFEKVFKAAPHVPIIIYSALDDERAAAEMVARGAQDYLVKGKIDQRMLARVIRYAIERNKLEDMREEFVSMIIHELRAPLTTALEGISQINEGILGDVQEQQKGFLEMAERHLRRLNRIVDDLLDVSKIELGKMNLNKESFDLGALISETSTSFKHLAERKKLTISEKLPDTPVFVSADQDKIAQVLMNLLSNAVKFTQKGSVEITLSDQEDGVECRITDTGEGISEEEVSELFNKFKQFKHPRKDDLKGTGLGLAICQGIVRAHQGDIWVESKVGEGSSFAFKLPKGNS